jgi:hypothetical protein
MQFDCRSAKLEKGQRETTLRADFVHGRTFCRVNFANELQLIKPEPPAFEAEESGVSASKIHIAKIAEHNLEAPEPIERVAVATLREIFKFRRIGTTFPTGGNLPNFQFRPAKRAMGGSPGNPSGHKRALVQSSAGVPARNCSMRRI